MGMSVFLILLRLLPLGFILAMCLWTVWRAVSRPRPWRGEPACERCGYIVAGLASFGCPECGADMRRTGIITPAMELRRRGSLTGALLAWVAGGLVVGYFAMLVLNVYFGYSLFVVRSQPVQTTTTQEFTPTSGAFKSATVVMNQLRGGGTNHSDMEITVTANDGQTSSIRATDSGNGWSYVSLVYPTYGTRQSGVPHSFEIQTVMKNAGVDVDRAGAAEEYNQLAIRVLEIVDGASVLTNVTPSPMSAFIVGQLQRSLSSPAPGSGGLDPGGIVMLIGVLLWIVGAVFIVLRRRALVRAALVYEEAARSPKVLSAAP